jgi:predicted nucleic acid-binding protein
VLRSGPGHWKIFRELCQQPGVRGKLVADAAHAALAIETGCEWITADTDYARFAPQLRWQHL